MISSRRVLLALVRGAGVAGLSGDAGPRRRSVAGWLLRPLLEFTRADLEAWARSQDSRGSRIHRTRTSISDRNLSARRGRAGAARALAGVRRAAPRDRAAIWVKLAQVLESLAARRFRGRRGRGRSRRRAPADARPRSTSQRAAHWMRHVRRTRAVDPQAARDRARFADGGRGPTPLVDLGRRGATTASRRCCICERGWLPDRTATFVGCAACRCSCREPGSSRAADDPAAAASMRASCGRELSVRFRAGGERIRPAGELHRRS